MIKNNKGFTMVELLAAVTILGILATIAIVSVTNTMEKSHKEYDEKQNKLFTTAAQTYFTDNRSELPKKLLTTNTVTLKKLIEENYIEEIIDYKKKAYDKTKSVATIKKTGAGKYMYYSTLVSGDGKRKVSDAPDTNNKNGTVNITIKTPDLTYTDMKTPFSESGKIVYYVNKKISIPISLEGSEGISSYQYRIDKLTSISSTKVSRYKTSGEIEIDNTSFNDTLTIDAKDFANGIYKLSVNAYGYQAEASTKDASYIIVIDKTKPKCIINMSRNPNGNKVEDISGIYWHKAGPLSVIMKITEKNKYKYTFILGGKNPIAYDNNDINSSYTININTNLKDAHYYGYLKDKAGNIGECRTEKPIYYDNEYPTCDVSGGEDEWINKTSDIQSRTIIAICDDTGGSDCAKGNNRIDHQKEYSSNIDTTSAGASGNFDGGTVEDKAGNVTRCAANQVVKIDKNPPSCNVSGGSSMWTNQNVTISATCSDTGGSGCITRPFSQTYAGTMNTSYAGAEGIARGGSVLDAAGNETECPANQILKIDKIRPTCSISTEVIEGKPANGPYDSGTEDKYVVTASCSDGGGSGCTSSGHTITSTGNPPSNLGSVSDNAGNVAYCDGDIVIPEPEEPVDNTKSSQCKASGGSSQWTNDKREITVKCIDRGKGCDSSRSSPSKMVYDKDTNIKVQPHVTDNSGNVTLCTTQIVKVDKTAPTIKKFERKDLCEIKFSGTIQDKLSGLSKYVFSKSSTLNGVEAEWYNKTGTSETTVSKNIENYKGVNYYLYVKDQAGNVSTAGPVVSYKEFDCAKPNEKARAYYWGKVENHCGNNSSKVFNGHPYKKFDFKLYYCECDYDIYTGRFNSYLGNTNAISESGYEHTNVPYAWIVYNKSDNGKAACNLKSGYKNNQYVYSICGDAEVPSGGNIFYHGWNFYKGTTTNAGFPGKNNWYHNTEKCKGTRVSSGATVREACTHACKMHGNGC